MGCSTDLHIHSCLSPCADNDMTPWNIAGMAKVAGLDVIAVTDHNSAKNLPEVFKAGAEYGVEVLAGMELCAREEIHILAYFPALKNALEADAAIYRYLPDIANNTALFGEQLIIGEGDAVTGNENKLLISALSLTLSELSEFIAPFGGLLVPAHINRGSSGMLGGLGLMPPLPEYPVVEVCKSLLCPKSAVSERTVLNSSDAHHLGDIAVGCGELPIEGKTARAVFEYLLCAMKAL